MAQPTPRGGLNLDFAPTTDDMPESEADFEPYLRSARAEPEWSECSLLHESTEDHGPSPARGAPEAPCTSSANSNTTGAEKAERCEECGMAD
ncbi:MAG: hypothetical protein JW751_05220 [Polyangiaceae bacterium]|nr:hypothetical protein [Polyangiaceae bacterium]